MRRGAMGMALLLYSGCAATPHPSTPLGVAAPAAASPPADESFRTRPPAGDPPIDLHLPAARVATLANGMRVLVVERHSTPSVVAELVVLGGTAARPDEAPAAVRLMIDCLVRGTTRHNQREIFGLMDQNLFALDVGAGASWLSFSVRAFSSSFDVALDTLSDIVLHPTFPPQAVETERRLFLGTSSHDGDNPTLIGERNLYAALYGAGHPYARIGAPKSATLARLTRDDVVRVWREMMDPTQAVLVIAGDIQPASAIAQAEALFGGWKGDPACRPPAQIPPPSPGPSRLVVVDRPKAPQATIFYGAIVPGPSRPGYYPTLVLQRLFGGMRSSEVEIALREQLGATWSGGARLQEGRLDGTLWWQGSVARDRASVVLGELATRIRQLAERGPTPEEMTAATGLLARSTPRRLETVRSVAETFVSMVGFDLPTDYIQMFRSRIEGVSIEALRDAVPDPARMKAVVVGDLAALEAPLLGLGWGPIEVRDADGNVVRVISR